MSKRVLLFVGLVYSQVLVLIFPDKQSMSAINNIFIPYPLQLESALFEKIWGGSAILALKQQAEESLHIGESWEIYSKNYISHGAYAGLTLEDLIQQYPLEMIGYNNKNGEW